MRDLLLEVNVINNRHFINFYSDNLVVDTTMGENSVIVIETVGGVILEKT